MGRKALEIGEIERIAISNLAQVFEESTLTHQVVADRAGISRSGVLKTLAGQRATSVSEFVALCHALGLTPWRVLRQAEDAVRAQADDARAYTAEAEAKLQAVLQGGYVPAARHHEPDPYEGVGEENQDEEEN
ncbi:helix-turn-helix domain-containing protein [Trueperella abortisuis]|uniref:Transcriptional regulator with XRE-family HTH domain n=1 Tax=Trueperella abortisuis TaxID=445930 RepID=A0ABT9PJY0_9ACTO|nr:helix-turn-helix transcriptional regulator [Trueperella abortisuis]MDP9833032.1 transcriptional regulator with XRE-family HTH domain [Trueperella abortisuis]